MGLLLGSRELLWLFGRISGTFVHCISLSELCLPGESASCQIQGESADWWSSTTIIASQDVGGFQRDSARHVDVASFRGRHVKSAAYKYRDSTRHVHLTGSRHHTSLPPTRVQCPLCGYPSASFHLRRFSPLFLFRRRGFFSSPIHRIRHAHTRYIDKHTLDTSPTGVFGSNGFHGESV